MYVHELVERIRDVEADRDVRVLTSNLRTHGPISELDPALLLDDPPYVQRLHHAPTPLLSYPRLQALQYYLGHHQPNIIHGYSFWYQPADAAAHYARKHNIPFIFHPIYYENANRQKLAWQLYKKIIGYQTFAAADIVAVISPYEQSLIKAAGFPVKRFELIPPGIDTREFERPRLNPYLKRKIRGPVVLAVSRLAPDKGLEDLIASLPAMMSAIPDIQLVIIGEDFGEQVALEQQVQSLGISNQVHFWGKVDRGELIAAYQHATVFVHPSHYEAFGIVVAEAEAAGIPVVARNVAAIPFVAPPETGARLFSNNNEMIQAVLDFTRNDSVRAASGRAGAKYVAKQFSWPQIIQKIIGLYDELVS